jgi:urease accessory protein
MKLLPLGQTRAQALLLRLGERMAEGVRDADALGLEDLGGFLPLLDIASMRHEVAKTRLFIS